MSMIEILTPEKIEKKLIAAQREYLEKTLVKKSIKKREIPIEEAHLYMTAEELNYNRCCREDSNFLREYLNDFVKKYSIKEMHIIYDIKNGFTDTYVRHMDSLDEERTNFYSKPFHKPE